MNTPHDPAQPIDIQDYLTYYNASYIKTKIEKTNNALLETDGNGRFTSVKFDDDSVVYSLNVETVTDEAAYQDAMNEYNYKKEQYENLKSDFSRYELSIVWNRPLNHTFTLSTDIGWQHCRFRNHNYSDRITVGCSLKF